jgi:hypothetical protein
MYLETHNLKLQECYADAVFTGEKTFEIRRTDDRSFQKGDRIMFTVVNRDGVTTNHALHHVIFEITYVLPYYGLKDGFVALAIRRLGKDGEQDD